MDWLAKYVCFILTKNELLLSKLNSLCVMGLCDCQSIFGIVLVENCNLLLHYG